MKSYYYKLANLVLFAIIPLYCFSQNNSVNGVYIGSKYRAIIIEDDKFTILSSLYVGGLEMFNNIDPVIAFGRVQYYDSNYIELNSADYNKIVSRSITYSESQKSTIKDSVLLRFFFPFSGQYKILISIGNRNKYELINQPEIKIPKSELKDNRKIGFEIYNLDFIRNIGIMNDYCRITSFRSLSYTIKEYYTNCISIHIPELTNTFFRYYVIKGEYARIVDNDLEWRGEFYYLKE